MSVARLDLAGEEEEVTTMNKEWLTTKTTVAELEAKHMHKGKPFGYQNAKWEALKAKIVNGDELWEFSSPPESWRSLAGRAGVALVRDGEVIDSIVTILS
jgi:hypothetical protein